MTSGLVEQSPDAGGIATSAPSWTKRVLLGTLGTAGATVALAAFATSAFANAANPLPVSTGTISPAGGNAVRVAVSGEWNWGELSGSSVQSDCNKRYGVGYAVDWWGFGTGGAAIPGLHGQVAVTTGGTPSLADQPLAPSVALTTQSHQTFHASSLLNGFDNNLCAHQDPQGFPTGPWSSYAIYPNEQSVPNLICVNMYDLHGSTGVPKLSDFTSSNGDNSIKTNDFDPTVNQQYCFHPTFQHPVSITVDKQNDAHVGGGFHDTETADSAGQDVTFQVTVTNTSAVSVVVDSVQDAFPVVNNVAPAGSNVTCRDANNANVVGQTLAAGASVTCTFDLTNYAPANGSLTDRATVTVHEAGLTSNSTSGHDDSTVNAPDKASLAAHILLCDNGQQTTTQVPNGSLSATGPTNLGPLQQIPATTVDPGNYAVGATAPNGYELVTCGNYNGAATQNVTLAPGDSKNVKFYVDQIRTPNVTVNKQGPAEGTLGDNGVYTIRATNNGNAASPAQTFTDTLDPGETFVAQGSSTECTALGKVVTCTLVALPVGGHADFTVVVSYDATGTLTDCATINGQQVPSCVTTDVGEPKLRVLKDGPAEGDLNGTGSYTMTVKNIGNRASKATTFTDTLPTGETFVAQGSSAACSVLGQVVTCSVNALAAGASQTFTVVVSYSKTGILTDCATIAGQPNASCVDTEVGEPKLHVVKDGPATGDLGGTGSYTMTVINSGNRASTATTFTDTLPSGETFVAQGSSAGCSAVGQVVTCSVNALAAGHSQGFTVVVSYSKTGILTDCATIAGQANPSCVDTEVGAPKLQVVKDGPAAGVLGGNGTYTMTVTNTGNRGAAATTFTDTLPAGETFVAQGSSAACSAAGQVVTCSVNALAAGAHQTFTVVVSYSKTGSLTDCATIGGQANPSCVTTDVGQPNVTVVKSGPATGTLGNNGLYTLVATNTGNRASTATTVFDTLPAGETFVAQGSSTACSAMGQIVSCSLGSLPAGGSASFTVVVSYTKTGNLTDCATVAGQANPSCVTTNIPGEPALTVTKTNDADGDGIFHDSETATTPGDPVTFKVVVTNTSTVPVAIDSVVDVYAATSVNECASLLGTVLAPGASATCTFTITGYAPAAGSSLLDTVTVLGHEDGNPGNTTQGSDTSNVRTAKPPAPGPDLAIVKSADKDTVQAGDTLTYTLAVTNVGDGPTTGAITVTDSVPSGLDLVSVDGGSNWDCTVSGRFFSCLYLGGDLAAGASAADITVVTTVNDTASIRVINTGVVDTPGDVNPDNDRSTVKTPVTKVLPEKIVKTPPTAVLPFTGSKATSLLPVGLLMVLFGAALLGAARRRRTSVS